MQILKVNAAGLLIEETGKAVRRNKTIDDAFFESLYSRVRTLQRLDAVDTDTNKKVDLGPLPTESVILLCGIGAVWVGIGTYVVASEIKKRKKLR